MRSSTLRAAAGACAAAIALAGCSSSASGGNSSASSVIPIGTIGTFTGPLASGTLNMPEVMKAWVSWTNAHGGLKGHQVKLYLDDDAGNATTAITDVKTLIQRDKVVAIV